MMCCTFYLLYLLSNIVVNVTRFGIREAELPSSEFPRHASSHSTAAQVLRCMEAW